MGTRSAFLAIALLVVGTSSASAQQEAPEEHVPAGPCFLQLKGGSGSTYYRVCLSPSGNLTRLESPLGVEHLNVGQAVEGWGLCREDGWNNAWDFDAGREGDENYGGGITSTWYKQPNGLNTMPFTVYHDVSPGLRVEQHFTRNTTEREITVKMVVKNVGTTTVPTITLHRMLDVDAGGTWGDDLWAKTADSVAVLDRGSPGRGVSLEAGTRKVPHLTDAGGYRGMHNMDKGGEYACDMFTANPPGGAVATGARDYVALATYSIGTLGPGYSKTVTFIYRVFDTPPLGDCEPLSHPSPDGRGRKPSEVVDGISNIPSIRGRTATSLR